MNAQIETQQPEVVDEDPYESFRRTQLPLAAAIYGALLASACFGIGEACLKDKEDNTPRQVDPEPMLATDTALEELAMPKASRAGMRN